MVEQKMFAENFVLPMLAIFAATVISESIFLMLRATLGESISVVAASRSIVLPAATYNAVLAGLSYPLLTRVLRRQTRTESRSGELDGAFAPTLQRVRKK